MLPTLKNNDKIYICAPAKAIDHQSVQFAKRFFETSGYHVELSKHLLGQQNYFSGSETERLEDLQNGLDHPEAKVILCARGGYGCIQLLEKLDWTSFHKNPKWIVGFSDITVLHLALSKMGLPSLHATMPLNFEKNSKESLSTMITALKKEPYKIHAPESHYNQTGKVSGEVVGGNLAIVHAMLTFLGANFFKNKILFIEDIGEHLYQIDRMFYGLKFLKVIENISGLIIGSFTTISDTVSPFGKTLNEIIHSHIKHRAIPVGFGFPCGHQDDNQAIVFGQSCEFIVTKEAAILIQNSQNPLS